MVKLLPELSVANFWNDLSTNGHFCSNLKQKRCTNNCHEFRLQNLYIQQIWYWSSSPKNWMPEIFAANWAKTKLSVLLFNTNDWCKFSSEIYLYFAILSMKEMSHTLLTNWRQMNVFTAQASTNEAQKIGENFILKFWFLVRFQDWSLYNLEREACPHSKEIKYLIRLWWIKH